MTREEAYQAQLWATVVYSGISKQIDFEINCGTDDRRYELKYLVNRYCDECMISGNYLREKFKEYCKFAEEKYGKINNE